MTIWQPSNNTDYASFPFLICCKVQRCIRGGHRIRAFVTLPKRDCWTCRSLKAWRPVSGSNQKFQIGFWKHPPTTTLGRIYAHETNIQTLGSFRMEALQIATDTAWHCCYLSNSFKPQRFTNTSRGNRTCSKHGDHSWKLTLKTENEITKRALGLARNEKGSVCSYLILWHPEKGEEHRPGTCSSLFGLY